MTPAALALVAANEAWARFGVPEAVPTLQDALDGLGSILGARAMARVKS